MSKRDNEIGQYLIILATVPAITSRRGNAQCLEGCTALHTITGEATGDQHGWVSNDVGDLDHDGIHDFVLTAPTNGSGGLQAGRIYVYTGATGDEFWHATGTSPGWWLGHDAAPAGDIDGDGKYDYLITAASDLSLTGRSYVIAGTVGVPAVEGDCDNDGDVDLPDFGSFQLAFTGPL